MSNQTELLLKEEVHRIVGCAMEVSNVLGHGLPEKVYENALVVEFGLQQIACQQQQRFEVQYKTSRWASTSPTSSALTKSSLTQKPLNASLTTNWGR